jgi:hypothetical protein
MPGADRAHQRLETERISAHTMQQYDRRPVAAALNSGD